MFLSGMLGLGDNFYQRAAVRLAGPLHLMTSWPQLYSDLPDVKCVRPQTTLRTQAKNAARPETVWHPAPAEVPRRVHYTGSGTMLDSLMRSVGVQSDTVNFDGPPVAKTNNRPYIVVRPATVRSEWFAGARNPRAEYIDQATRILGEKFDIISIADLAPGKEWADGELPFAHERYHAGELPVEELLELVGNASGVVGGVGWLLPAAIAYRVPMLLLYGGWGYVNGPQHTIDSRMDASRVTQVFPDRFCMCNNKAHDCDKTITGFSGYVERFADELK
jgi:hypothetical protein